MSKQGFFHNVLPNRPAGRYAQVIMLRVTEGYALFQTDGELNRTRVSAGIADGTPMTRITLFKRKQTTPERLHGRELLRRYGLISEDCKYNESPCGRCVDCVTYGFAIGDGGSEKSKILVDSAHSLTDYASSHQVFTLNAPYEDGTMSEKGKVTSRINSQDHVKPQTIFPSVVTTRDLTQNLFTYVLMNVLGTRRYGATTTRGGTMKNLPVAIVFSDSEIFSNLQFTQALYDSLQAENAIDEHDPVNVQVALDHAHTLIPKLLKQDGGRVSQTLMGTDLQDYIRDLSQYDENAFGDLLRRADEDAKAYHNSFIKK